MRKTIFILSTFLLLTISLVMAPFMLFPAHAATGTVCIDARTTASCQTITPNLVSAVGTILTIHVNIQSSDALNAFDISILASHDILQPSSANTTGTIVPNVQTVVNCIGGMGTGCTVSDTADTIHVAGVSLGQTTASPTTGILFVATYNVISPGSLVIGFQTGCKGSSVTGTDTCLTIANGTPSPVAELAQTAFFSTDVTPTFAMSATPGSLGILEAASGSSKVTATSINGFTGLVDLTATSTSTNVQPSLNPASVSLTPSQSSSSNLTILVLNSTLPGTYTISVTGTGGTVTNSVQVSVTVIPRQPSDFAMTVTPLGRTVSQGNSASYSVVLRAIAIPVRINMTSSVYPVVHNGPIVAFNPSSVSVQPGSPALVMMTVSTSATTPQTSYIILATGTTISIARSFTVQLTVGPPAPPPPDFTMSLSQLTILILNQKTSSTIEIKAINGFTGTVTLSAVLTPGGFKNPAIMFQPNSIKLSSGQTGVTTLVVRTNEHTLAGTYFLTVTGSSGSITHAAVIKLIVSQPLINLT